MAEGPGSNRSEVLATLRARLTPENVWRVTGGAASKDPLYFDDVTQESRGEVTVSFANPNEVAVFVSRRPTPEKSWAARVHLIR